MADGTTIEWTDATWNPVTGCAVVSPGCTNCYAMRLAGTRLAHHPSRAGLTRDTKAGPVWTGEVRFNREWLDQPLRWRRSRMIFVCAHGDVFAEGVEDSWLDQIFAVMAMTPQHTFQVLTKRPERMRAYLKGERVAERIARAALDMLIAGRLPKGMAYSDAWPVKSVGDIDDPDDVTLHRWPLTNVWAGISAEDQRRADERVPILLDTPAAVRWVSAEPLLGPIDFSTAWHGEDALSSECWGDCAWCTQGRTALHNCQRGFQNDAAYDKGRSGLDWIVVGGESGTGARPMHPNWASSIRDQCAESGVPFLFKQWGAWAPICEMSEAEVDRCYRSNRRAKEGESQETLDEIYGQTRIVPSRVLHNDGSQHHNIAPGAWLQGTGAMTMFAIGKKAAGRLLDGKLHDGFPGGAKDG